MKSKASQIAPMMSSVQRAKAMLPDMPGEVFAIWIEPLVIADGWPFFSSALPAFSGAWSQYFVGEPVQTFNDLLWERKQIPLSFASFEPHSRSIIKWVIETHVHGRLTPVAKVKKGQGGKSFLRSRQFIQRTGRVHTPVVLWKQFGGYKIMDGNHRVAACFSLSPGPRFVLDAWVAHGAH